MKTRILHSLIKFIALLIVLSVAGCASEAVTRAMSGPPQVRTDIFPGNNSSYSFGTSQKAENFLNVERAQSNESPRGYARNWADITPSSNAIGNIGNLQSYFRFDVRWKLKDGREFILENIDVRNISNDYLRKNPILLQWQREGRARDRVGDYDPLLAFEVKDDTVLLKWVVRINNTPVNQRLTSTGVANKWDVSHEEILIATLKGNSTTGINFNIKRELTN